MLIWLFIYSKISFLKGNVLLTNSKTKNQGTKKIEVLITIPSNDLSLYNIMAMLFNSTTMTRQKGLKIVLLILTNSLFLIPGFNRPIIVDSLYNVYDVINNNLW